MHRVTLSIPQNISTVKLMWNISVYPDKYFRSRPWAGFFILPALEKFSFNVQETKKPRHKKRGHFWSAERERFELSELKKSSTVFETAPFNHSGISPNFFDLRKGRDSNPRYGYPYTRSPGVPVKPLLHLSIYVKASCQARLYPDLISKISLF